MSKRKEQPDLFQSLTGEPHPAVVAAAQAEADRTGQPVAIMRSPDGMPFTCLEANRRMFPRSEAVRVVMPGGR